MRSVVVLFAFHSLWAVYLTGCNAGYPEYGSCPAEQREAWSHRGRNGPSRWGKRYPNCDGQMQSPIDIQEANVKFDPNLQKLKLTNFDVPLTQALIFNNGHTVELEPSDNVERSIQIERKIYTLTQFHFHWGDIYFRGSEHTVNGKQYANEVHFVFATEDEEIAVVGVILQQQFWNNPGMEPLIRTLKEVEYKGNEVDVRLELNLESFVPSNPMSYFRYNGSLTTPDCSENVIWTVANDPVSIGTGQMMEFRKIKAVTKSDFENSNGQCYLSNNYRPIQPLNGRIVYSSV